MPLKRFVYLLILFISVPKAYPSDSAVIYTNYPEGRYFGNIYLDFKSSSAGLLKYHFNGDESAPEVIYSEPILLSSLSGEIKTYTIEALLYKNAKLLDSITVTYTIDKTVVPPPVPEPDSGVYSTDVSINFNESGVSVFYSLTGETNGTFKKWNGKEIILKQTGEQQNYNLAAFSQDSDGRRSTVVSRNYVILPVVEKTSSIKVYSPVEGSFMNSQLLYLNTTGFKWIRYSIGNNDPAKFGTTYRGPILFKAKGAYTLNIAGLPEGSTSPIKKTITFTIKDSHYDMLLPESGVYYAPLKITSPGADFKFTLSDKTDRPALLSFNNSELVLNPVTGTKICIPLRIFPKTVSGNDEYRFFYIFDREKPGSPVITFTNGKDKKNIKIRIFGKSSHPVYYTLDGSSPDKYSSLYRNPFYAPIPKNVTSGSIMVKAVSIAENNSESSVVSKLVTFDFEPPDAPEFELEKISSTRYRIVTKNAENNTLYYLTNYSGNDPGNPDTRSFLGKKDMLLSFPKGIKGDFILNAVLVDSSGNISDLSSLKFTYDTYPPRQPVFEIKDKEISLAGAPTIYYAFDKKGSYQLYTAKIPETLYSGYEYIYAYSQDREGHISDTVGFRIPKTSLSSDFRIKGLSDHGLYNSDVTLRSFPNQDTVLYYSLSVDGVNGSRKLLPGTITFSCPDGLRKEYILKIYAENRYGKDEKNTAVFNFVIDKENPQEPLLENIENGKLYNDAVTVKASRRDVSDVWILLQEGNKPSAPEDIDSFFQKGILLNEGYVVKGRENSDIRYTLSAASVDAAGNFTISTQPLSFRIDRKPPAAPRISGFPENRHTNTDVVFSMFAETDSKIYYRIDEDGSPLDNGTVFSYTAPVSLKGKANGKTDYTVHAWTVDAAGNKSSRISVASVEISKEKPRTIEPVIIPGSDYSSIIYFPVSEGNKVFYRFGKGSFKQYTDPFNINVRNSLSATLFYYTQDIYSNSSIVKNKSITLENRKRGLITGVTNNGIYNHKVSIKKRFQNSNLYYEIGFNSEKTPPVSVISPQFDSKLDLDVEEGQVTSVTVRVREFDKETLTPLSKEERYFFTIDKEKPAIPVISGIADKDFYQDNREIKIKSDNGSVFYELFRNNQSVTGGFKKYTGSIYTEVKNGEFAEFRLSSYTKDAAGNTSSVHSLNFSIDKAIVYLSAHGKDSYDGTRTRPLKTLNEALLLADKKNRNTIYVTEGEYLINDTITLNNDISIIGGFNLESWGKSSSRTVFSAGSSHNPAEPLFILKKGKASIINSTITNLDLNSSVIDQSGGNLLLRKCEFIFANGRGMSLFRAVSGIIEMKDSSVTIGSANNSTIFSVSNSVFKMENVRLNVTGAVSRLRLFDFTDKVTSIMNNIHIGGGISQMAELYRLKNSSLELNNSRILSGKSTISSLLFYLENSDLAIKNSNIESGKDSGIVSFVDAKESSIDFYSTSIKGYTGKGISVFNLDSSSFTADRLAITTEKTKDFMFIFRGNDSFLRYTQGSVTIQDSFDTSFVTLRGSDFSITGSTVSVSGSTYGNTLMNFKGMRTIKIFDSVFKTDGGAANTACVITGNNRVVIQKNSIYGWQELVIYNGLGIKNSEELNTFSGFSSSPFGNISN